MTPSKILPVALLSVGFLINTLAAPAEARRGSRASTGASSSTDLEYIFSIYDTSPTDEAISCTVIANGCLFKDAISDLEITSLSSGSFVPNGINSAEVGTSLLSLYGPETPPNQDINGNLTDFPKSFSETLSLTARLLPAGPPPSGSPQAIVEYTITDLMGEPIQSRISGTQGGFETEFIQDFSFSLFSDGIVDTTLPDEGLVNSIKSIVDFSRGETSISSGYYFGRREVQEGIPITQNNIDDNITAQVPEPASVLALFASGLASAYFTKRKTTRNIAK